MSSAEPGLCRRREDRPLSTQSGESAALQQGPDYDYDPVCFDIRERTRSGDYRIVNIDHEEILCNSRINVVAELACSFEELVQQTKFRADKS